MSATRTDMDRALRSAVDEHLRPNGFTGSFPHLRRRRSDRIDLISVQHFSAGGSFVVEAASAPPDGITIGDVTIGPTRIRAVDINEPRPRLGSDGFPTRRGDQWFVYGPRHYEQPGDETFASPEKLASEVIRLIGEQAEPWWSTRPFPR